MRTLTSHQVTEADRDRCIDVLNDAYAQGHVDKAELDVPVERALATQHSVELEELQADLPVVVAATELPRRRRRWETLAAAGILVIAWGVAGIVASRFECQPAQQATCVATGLTTSDSGACPDVSEQQEALTDDADRAVAAAEQVAVLTSELGGNKLNHL